MSAQANVHYSEEIFCLAPAVRFSFILEEKLPSRVTFAPLSYDLQEFRKSLRSQQDRYEEDCEEFCE